MKHIVIKNIIVNLVVMLCQEMMQIARDFVNLVIMDHLINNLMRADKDKQLFRTCYGGVKQISGQKHWGCRKCGDYDRGIFASLAFMYCYRVCGLKVLKQAKVICDLAIIKGYQHCGLAYLFDNSDISVEYSHSRLTPARPFDLVIVAYLHNTVTLAVGYFAVFMLSFAVFWGIQHGLKQNV